MVKKFGATPLMKPAPHDRSTFKASQPIVTGLSPQT
jgi:hypothetical protein